MERLKKEYTEFKILLRSVPTGMLVLFTVAVISMNLLANKSLNLPMEWFVQDCGIIISWFVFLTMDVVTNRFGPKASTELSVFATAVSLLFCVLMFFGSLLPGQWQQAYTNAEAEQLSNAVDRIIGGTWYVISGSTIAFVLSSFVNNFVNFAIGKMFKKNPNGRVAFFARCYVSTTIGQLADNFIFAYLVSKLFFGWTIGQCVTASLVGVGAELLCQMLFFNLGYKINKRWIDKGVGEEYIKLCK